MTAADHANTVREGIVQPYPLRGTMEQHDAYDDTRRAALAALDALQTQAEDNTAEIEAVEAEVAKQERHVDTLLARAETAEAELAKVREGRDADRRILDGFRQAAEAERDRLERLMIEMRGKACYQAFDERDRVADALRAVRAWVAQEEEVGVFVPTLVYQIIDASLGGEQP